MNSPTQPAAAGEVIGSPFDATYRGRTITLVTGISAVAFEFMAISTAMPAVAHELDAVASYGSAFSFMLVGQLLGIVLAGAWSDRRGPYPVAMSGLAFFAVGVTICGFAQSFPVLLFGRVLTGLGAGLVVVALFVVIGRVYPEVMRPRVFSWISAAWVLPSLVGAPLSSFLTQQWTWRLVFWAILAPTALTLVGLLRMRSAIRRPADSTSAAQDSPDSSATERAEHLRAARLGALVAAGAGVLQYGATQLGGGLDGYALAALGGLAVVALAGRTLLPERTLVLRRGLPSVIASRFLFNATFSGALTYVPLMLTTARGVSLANAGWVLASGSCGWTFGSWIQGNKSFEGRRERLVVLGAVALTTGMIAAATIGYASAPWQFFFAAIVLSGMGMGLGSTTLSVLALVIAPREEHGKASSALQLSDVLGSTIGIATGSAIWALLSPTHGHGPVVYGTIWGAMAVLAGLAIVSGSRCRK